MKNPYAIGQYVGPKVNREEHELVLQGMQGLQRRNERVNGRLKFNHSFAGVALRGGAAGLSGGVVASLRARAVDANGKLLGMLPAWVADGSVIGTAAVSAWFAEDDTVDAAAFGAIGAATAKIAERAQGITSFRLAELRDSYSRASEGDRAAIAKFCRDLFDITL